MRKLLIYNKENKLEREYVANITPHLADLGIELIHFMDIDRENLYLPGLPVFLLVYDSYPAQDEYIAFLKVDPSIGNIVSAINTTYPSPEPIVPQPTELEIIGQEVTNLKLANIQKDMTINILGQELANVKIQLLQLQEGE